jgi:hypothetical protein
VNPKAAVAPPFAADLAQLGHRVPVKGSAGSPREADKGRSDHCPNAALERCVAT